MNVNAAVAAGVGQDPAPDTTHLPGDHTPKFLAEAIRIYSNSKPPFVCRVAEGSERAVYVTQNGQRPPLPIRANLVARPWGLLGNNGTYWTLDLNGERLIVRSFHNKGCISSAKWVYCCWTGVGEDFDVRPVAFTCINGEYTCAKGPAAAKQPTTKNNTLNSTTGHATTLPEDHPVEYLDEAEELYVNSRPPFVVHRTRHPRRRVYLATQDGLFSATSTRAEVVYRAWDSLDDYSTLDLDGKRFIVMGSPGSPPGGFQYHLWLGYKEGRVKKAVAHCGLLGNARRSSLNLIDDFPEMDQGSNSLSSSESEEDQGSELGNGVYCYDNFKNAFDTTATPRPAPSKFHIRQSISSPRRQAQKERLYGKYRRSKRARTPIRPAHLGAGQGKIPANAVTRARSQISYASDDTFRLSDAPYKTPGLTPSTDNPTAPAPETRPLQTNASASLPTLTLYKQTHTTLRAARDSNVIGFVPLRLLTCMTMSTLFSSVIAASGYREHEEPIKCLMAVFDWKEESDVYKTIYIDKDTEGSFEIFLEIVDEAPCWKDEGGRCGIAIEVVRA